MKLLTLFLAAACAGQAAPGYFSVTQTASGRWDLLDPQGRPFYSTGVDVVVPKDFAIPSGGQGYDTLPKYKDDKAAWAKAALGRLRNWGFNSLGAWCDDAIYGQGLPYTVSLALVGYQKGEDRLVDAFAPEFVDQMAAAAKAGTAKWKGDKDLIGYYLDNELPWYGNTGWPGPQNTPLLDKHLALPPSSPGHAEALKSLSAAFPDAGKQALKDPLAFLASKSASAAARGARDAFLEKVAERYFSSAAAAVRAQDPHHLILGDRFAGSAPRPVIVAAGRYCDVISVNHYSKSGNFDEDFFDTIYALTKRPQLLTEFSYRAMENRSGDLNTKGADVTVATQADRAIKLKQFLGEALELKYLMGYHWFQYFDESPQGRSFDGENSNYGLVDIYDEPYQGLIDEFKAINAGAAKRHQAAKRPLPLKAPERKEVRLRTAVGAAKTLAGPRSLGDFGGADFAKAGTWNEASAKGELRQENGKLVLEYSSGNEWGLGVFLAPAGGTNSDGSADLLGASKLVLALELPKGTKFSVFLTETGAGEPGRASYDGVAGSDGESYTSGVLMGTGKREDYVIDLAQLGSRPEWGNQQGGKVIDVQAVKTVDLSIAGKQGSGRLVLYSAEARP